MNDPFPQIQRAHIGSGAPTIRSCAVDDGLAKSPLLTEQNLFRHCVFGGQRAYDHLGPLSRTRGLHKHTPDTQMHSHINPIRPWPLHCHLPIPLRSAPSSRVRSRIRQELFQHLALRDTRIRRPAESVDAAGREEGVEVALACLALVCQLHWDMWAVSKEIPILTRT